MRSNSIRKSTFPLLVIPLLLLLTLPGCATIFSGTTDTLKFSSDIDGVRVYINGRLVGKTPLEIKVAKTMEAKGPKLKAVKENFETQEFTLQKKLNKVAILNSSSLLSWGTDLISGALWEYEPKKYHIELVPLRKTAQTPEFYKKRFLYRYVLYNYGNILRDLSRGHGKFLNSLAAFLIDDMQQREDFLSLLKLKERVLLTSDSGFDFIDKLHDILANHSAVQRLLI